jgi:import inner membrane translocase subunit TIM8
VFRLFPWGLSVSQAEQQKAVFNELVSLITEKCFNKCIGTPGKSTSSSEQACMSQCALRFLETNQVILQRLQQQK